MLSYILLINPCNVQAQTDTIFHVIQPSVIKRQHAYYIIEKIEIEGNRKTNPKIIRRELDFLEGDTIWAAKVDSLLKWERNKIFNLNLFVTTNVSLTKNDTTPYVTMNIKVKEQWYTIPQFIFELIDRNFNVWWKQYNFDLDRANIGIKLMQKNCRGRNETLRLTFKTGFTRNYAISYDIPYLTKKQKLGMTISAEYSNNRNLAYGTDTNKLVFTNFTGTGLGIINNSYKAGIGFYYREAFFTTHAIEVNYNYNSISDTIASLNPDFFLNKQTDQRYFYLKYTFNHDRRDVKQFAHRGRLFRTELEQLGFTRLESQQLTRLTVTYARYLELGKHFLFATRFKAKTSFPVHQPWTNFQGLGYGQDLVRGYELYLVDGQHYLLSRNSFRLKTFSRIINFGKIIPIPQFRTVPIDVYFTVFSDYGYVWRTQPLTSLFDNRKLSNTLMGSIGIGANLVSYYNSVLRFEFSRNLLGEWNFFFGMATDI